MLQLDLTFIQNCQLLLISYFYRIFQHTLTFTKMLKTREENKFALHFISFVRCFPAFVPWGWAPVTLGDLPSWWGFGRFGLLLPFGLLIGGLDAGLVFMGNHAVSLVGGLASVLSAGGVFPIGLYGTISGGLHTSVMI